MEDLIKLIIFGVIVVASVLSEARKHGGGSPPSGDPDLGSLDDFFKNQPPAGGDSPGGDSSWNTPRKEEPTSLEALGTIFPVDQPSPRPPEPTRKKARKERKKERPPQPERHFSSEGPCLDEAPSLTGATNYEQMTGSLIASKSTRAPVLPKVRQPRLRLAKNDLVNAFILSEVMNRYDLNRIYSRIPDIDQRG